MQPLKDVSLRDHGIFELYFRIAAVEVVANFSVPYKRARRHQGAQFADENKVLLQRLELGNGHVIALNEVFVFFLSDELAVGKQYRADLPLAEFLAEFFVTGT